MSNILLKQAAGIGDIIFCQKIAKILQEQGNKVYWPVLPQLSYIKDYIRCDGLAKEPGSEYQLLDLDRAHDLIGGSLLTSKYRMVNLEWQDWQEHVILERNYKKEKTLFDVLNLQNKKFILVNNTFGTPPNIQKYEIPVYNPENLHIVYMDLIEGFNVFDWALVLERAKKIYTIDTSINYITEFLNLEADTLEIYSRYKPSNFSHIEGLWTRVDWKYTPWENI